MVDAALKLMYGSGVIVNVMALLQAGHINLLITVILGVLAAIAGVLKVRIMMYDLKAKKDEEIHRNNRTGTGSDNISKSV
jgi:hypothetical protein